MSALSTAVFQRVVPSVQSPFIINQQVQDVPYEVALHNGAQEMLGSPGDLVAYAMGITASTPSASNQLFERTNIPEVSYGLTQYSIPYYQTVAKAIINENESRRSSKFLIPNAQVLQQELMMAISLRKRMSFWFGNEGASEGFINQAPITALPTLTTAGGQTVSSWSKYDGIQLLTLLLKANQQILNATNNMAEMKCIFTSTRVASLLKNTIIIRDQFAGEFGATYTVWSAFLWILSLSGAPLPILIADNYLQGDITGTTVPDYLACVTPTIDLQPSPYGNFATSAGLSNDDGRAVVMFQAGGLLEFTMPISPRDVEMQMESNHSTGWLPRQDAQFVYVGNYA